MTLSVTHTFVSAIADAGDASLVEPSDWNASHTLTGTISVAQGGTGTATALTAGSVVFAGTAGVYSQDNANFYFDSANQLLQSTSLQCEFSTANQTLFPTTNSTGGIQGLSDGLWGLTYANTTAGPFSDIFDRADTAAGTIGNGWTLYGPYVASYPLPASANGYITSNTFTADANQIVYAERDLTGKNVQISGSISFRSGGGVTDAATAAMILSSSGNFIDTMMHLTVTRAAWTLQKRISGGAFTTILSGSHSLALGTTYAFEVEIYNNTATVNFNGASLGSVTDTAISTCIGRYLLFECYHPSASMIDLVSFTATGAITLAAGTNALTWDSSGIVTVVTELDFQSLPAIIQKGSSLLLYVDGQSSNFNAFFGGAGRSGVTSDGGTSNVGLGFHALSSITTGGSNVGVGTVACGNVTTGSNNFGLGTGALQNITTDSNNVGIGANAFKDTTSGGGNIGIGSNAGKGFDPGSFNTIIGTAAGDSFTSGDYNTLIGQSAGTLITSGSNNTLIGGWQGAVAAMSSVVALSDGASNLRLDYHYTNASTWTFDKAFLVTPVAVASLPAAGISGRRHFVTNATATTFASIVAGGGGNPVPVYDDGTNWRIG